MMCLNHSQIISSHPCSVERLSSMKLVPAAKMGWGPLLYTIASQIKDTYPEAQLCPYS